MVKELTNYERKLALDMLERARKAMALVEDYTQQELDRLAQAIGWFSGCLLYTSPSPRDS